MKLLYAILLVVLVLYASSQNKIIINAAYIGDGFVSINGGAKYGETYLGKMHFGVNYKPQSKLFKNGEFSIHIENTHGGAPSREYIGDLQVASNIDNGDYTYLFELWYKYTFNNFFVKFGVIDLNSDYLISDCGSVFLNSSFGIQPSASLNMPVPIFPMNALGVNLQYSFNEKIVLRTGVWDGNPGNLDRNPYNVQWKLSEKEGLLSATELQYNYNKSDKIKFGILFLSTEFKNLSDTNIYSKGNLQFHLIFEHIIVYNNDKPKVDFFANIGYLPNNNINVIPLSVSGGIYYSNLLSNKINDKIGIAFSYVKISNKLLDNYIGYKSNETVLELTYALSINDNITIQPDLQYIFNTGANQNISNAFVGFFRVIINN